MFASFVTGFGDFKVLTDMHFAWFTMPVLSGIGMYSGPICDFLHLNRAPTSGILRAVVLCLPHSKPIKVEGHWIVHFFGKYHSLLSFGASTYIFNS